jgi:hypothetical protein
MHPGLARRRFLLLRRIPFAVPTEGPSPTGRDHQCLQVILPREALRHGAVVACIVVYLLACHRPATDEVFQSFLGQRPWLPLPVVAGLALFGRIDAEQPHELRPKLHSIAVDNLEARLRSRSDNGVVICFRMSRGSQYEGKKSEVPNQSNLTH